MGKRSALRSVRKLVNRVSGARLCYGEPIRAGDRTVVPVASVRMAGGGGFGRSGERERSAGDGRGGGLVDAAPVGFIDVGADAAAFHPIVDRSRVARAVVGAGVAGAAIAAAVGRTALAGRETGRRRWPGGRARR